MIEPRLIIAFAMMALLLAGAVALAIRIYYNFPSRRRARRWRHNEDAWLKQSQDAKAKHGDAQP